MRAGRRSMLTFCLSSSRPRAIFASSNRSSRRNHLIIYRHLVQARQVGMLAFVEVVAVSEKSEVVENEGDSFGGEDGVRVGDMNVEMRAGRIAGVSELCDHLARFYFLMDAHADAVLLQMREHEVFVRRDANDDVIAGDVRQRDGWRLAGRVIFVF